MVHKQLPSFRPRPVFEREAGDFVENRELKTAADAELKDVPGRRVIEISYLLKFMNFSEYFGVLPAMEFL